MREKTIQQTYQKKTPLQHVLLRPDTYVGSIQTEKSPKWVLPKDGVQFQYKQITFVPALYKIFDQVLVNAADNFHRDKKMNLLKVEINQKDGFISVHNNGKGIPVQIHKQQKIYVPQLIFGHLLTGSNYDDNQKKVVGGRNGYGAKLANIFSLKFIVECGDEKKKKKFRMQWRKNMTTHNQPQISQYHGKDYTKIIFYPDFRRFRMEKLDDDIVSLLSKRVYDMAGLLPKVKTYLNDKQIPINSFIQYVDMYFEVDSKVLKIRDTSVDNDRWQVVVSFSQGQFRQVSFVNSICTTKGGTHVNYIVDQIAQKIQEKIKKKDKNIQVKPFQIKAHLWVFINCLVQNPTFDSQTKQNMTLKASQFGSTCELSQKMIKEILKSGVVDDIYNQAKAKQLSKLAKMTAGGKKAKITGIPKLEDANEAGTKNSQKCCLILTEGDSAKGMAMSGLEVVGRDYYGVFPLKGKMLNVREANNKTLMANQQVQNVLKILGLQIGKSYDDRKSLRYGSILIMADQDTDGSHIKGLVINFVHFFWPSLFKMPGFLKQFITPILKASKGNQKISFYTIGDYKAWCNQIDNIKTWRIKYYKGLGTSSDTQTHQYFQDLRKHKIDFDYGGEQDDKAIELIFSKNKIQNRKQWLKHYDPQLSMVYDRPSIHYKQFVDRQFIHFSNADNIRSIASVIDGFKPGQRKIIYSCFKRNLKQQIKVAQLSGYVSQHSAYHHGEMSLAQTIVSMAQNFVGSNNINLLMPNGQFGSRFSGGKDHASARYIFTCLNRITRYIFPQPDDHSLIYIEDDGHMVQPQYYVPIIPMVLVNGCQGIGTGWSTYIPNCNPRQIAQGILKRLNGEQFPQICPWFKGFEGEIIPKNQTSMEMKGIIQIDLQANTIHIKQLPVGKWTKDQKKIIQDLMNEEGEKIISMKQHHTKSKVHFELQVNQDFLAKHPDVQYFEKMFKTTSSISLNNLVGFNSQKRIVRYSSIKAIIDDFFDLRLQFYEKRKKYQVSKLVRDVSILSMKEKFIIEIVQQTIIIRNKKKVQICQILKKKGYTKFSDFPKVLTTKRQMKKKEQDAAEQPGQQNENESNKRDSSTQYNYLLSMPLWNLSFQKVQEIKKQSKQKQTELQIIQKTKIEDMWRQDIRIFLDQLDAVEKDELKQLMQAEQKVNKNNKKQKAKKVKKQKGKKEKEKVKAINWDQESEKKSTQKQKPLTTKPDKSKEPKKSQKKQKNDDLITRIKQNLKKKDAQSITGTETEIVARPKKRTKGPQDIGKEDNQYELLRVIKPKRNKKSATVLDSDQSFSELQLDDDDFSV